MAQPVANQVATRPVNAPTQHQTQPAQSAAQHAAQHAAHHRRTLIIVLSIVLGVVVIGACLAAYFLTRNVKLGKVADFALCKNEVLHGVKARTGMTYWIGSMNDGLSLFTKLRFSGKEGLFNDQVYTLTEFGLKNGSGTIASPMIGNLANSDAPVTPPPMLAEFDIAGLLGINDLERFWSGAGRQDITAGNGQVVGQLAVLSLSSQSPPVRDTDICFLCTPGGTSGFPLCVLGGVVSVHGVAGAGASYYNVGFMPLTALLGVASAPPPLACFLNAYPQLPLLTNLQNPTQITSDTVPNYPNTYSLYGEKRALPPLTCLWDRSLQTANGRQPPQVPPSTDPNAPATQQNGAAGVAGGDPNGVGGCHEMTVPAFDLVPADTAGKPNPRTFLDAVAKSGTTDPVSPIDLHCAYAARVGTTGGLGILRLRKWVAAPTPVSNFPVENVIVQSNPSIRVLDPKATGNPYVTELSRVPQQYLPVAPKDGGTTTATSLLYPPTTAADAAYSPWGLGKFGTGPMSDERWGVDSGPERLVCPRPGAGDADGCDHCGRGDPGRADAPGRIQEWNGWDQVGPVLLRRGLGDDDRNDLPTVRCELD